MKALFFLLFVAFTSFSQIRSTSGLKPIAKKVALVIGVNNYEHTSHLSKSVNDAQDMSKVFEKLGFKVTLLSNPNDSSLNSTFNKFVDGLRKDDLVFVYYSGQGFEHLDNSYILPTDFDPDLMQSAHSVNLIISRIQDKVSQKSYLIYDACRNFVSDQRETGSMKLSFLPYEKRPSGGVFIYASQSGGFTSETSNRNGLFTQEFIKNLKIPKLSLNQIVNNSAKQVWELSNKNQEPTMYGSIGTDLVLNMNEETTKTFETLSLKYDLTNFTPTVPDQGVTPDAVYWAVMYNAYGTQLAKQLNLKSKAEIDALCLSPAFAKKSEIRNCEEGTSLETPIISSLKNGAVLKKQYNNFDCNVTIPDSIFSKRIQNFQIEDYEAVFDESSSKNEKAYLTKKYLSTLNRPVIVSLKTSKNFGKFSVQNKFYQPDTDDTGYHAAVIIGYDPQGFKLLNSWGSKWGNEGFFWIKNDDFAKICNQGIVINISSPSR